MPNYSAHLSEIQRSKGENAVQAAAYISRSRLSYFKVDKDSGELVTITWDYSDKGGLVYNEIFAPEDAPSSVFDRQLLWNKAEAVENRKNSQPGRRFRFSLPNELTLEQNIAIVREFTKEYLVNQGMVADANVHYDNENNPHLHIQMTTRRLVESANGEIEFDKKKERLWGKKAFLRYLREGVSVVINRHLELYEHLGRVSHLSHKARGIDLIPGVHEGPAKYMNGELRALNQQIMAENTAAIRANPELVFQKIAINRPVFTKEDIAKALFEVLYSGIEGGNSEEKIITDAVSNAALNERTTAASKEIDERVNDEGVNQVVSESNAVEEEGNKAATAVENEGVNKETKSDNLSLQENTQAIKGLKQPFDIEALNQDEHKDFMVIYEQLLRSDKITLINPSDLIGRTLYALSKRVKLEEKYVATVEELASRSNHNLAIDDSNIDELSIKEQLLANLTAIGLNLQNKVNDEFDLKLEIIKGKLIKYNEQQRKAIVDIVNGNDISILEGYPGAGKTCVAKEIVRQHQKAGYQVIGVAPSSVAALVLAKATGIEAKNIDVWRKTWQEANGTEFELALRADYYEEPQYQNLTSQLTSKHLLIVDEASMIDLAAFDYLLSRVLKAGAKCLLIGDNNQFQAVGIRGAFKKTFNIAKVSSLTTVMRNQHDDYQIQQLGRQATSLLGQYKIHEALDIYKQLRVFSFHDNSELTKQQLLKDYIDSYLQVAANLERDDLASIRSIVIGSYTNLAVNYFNIAVRERLQKAGVLKGVAYKFKSGNGTTIELMRGEQIVFESNSKEFRGFGGVLNGEVATVLSFEKPDEFGQGTFRALLHQANGSKKIVLINTNDQLYPVRFRHGYAVTGYKLQGDESDIMMIYFEAIMGYEGFNVLMTRYRERVKVYAAKDELEDLVYQRMDADVLKIRKQFELEAYQLEKDKEGKLTRGQDGKLIRQGVANHWVGLVIAVSKRADTNFAIDYQAEEQLSDNEVVIQNYLEARKLFFEAHGKMQQWQERQEEPLRIAALHKKLSIAFWVGSNRDIKINPYGLVIAYSNEESELEEGKTTSESNKVTLRAWKQLNEREQNIAILEHLASHEKEDLIEIFEELQAARNELEKHALVICQNYNNFGSNKIEHELSKNGQDIEQQNNEQLTATEKSLESIAPPINDKVTMGSRILQLNLNYGTIYKHAGLAPYKYYFSPIANKATIINHANWGTILEICYNSTTFQRAAEEKIVAEQQRHQAEYSKITERINVLVQNPRLKAMLENLLKQSGGKGQKKQDQQLVALNQQFIDIQTAIIAESSKHEQETNNINLAANEPIAKLTELIRELQAEITYIQLTIASKNKQLEQVRLDYQAINNELTAINEFQSKLLPAFLSRVYQTPAKEVLKNWQQMIKQADPDHYLDSLIAVIQEPELLGDLQGIGIGKLLGINKPRRDAISNLSVLGKRLNHYQLGFQQTTELMGKMTAGDYNNLLEKLPNEIKALQQLLPNKYEEQIIDQLLRLQKEGRLDNSILTELANTDHFRGLLYEYYNTIEDNIRQAAELVEPSEPVKEATDELIVELAETEARTKLGNQILARLDKLNLEQENNRATDAAEKKPVNKVTATKKSYNIDFQRLKERLTSQDHENIFTQYVGLIHDKDIIQSGDKLKSGSIQMDLTTGEWTRYSRAGKNGRRFLEGDIFDFVGLATGKDSIEQLKLIAAMIGKENITTEGEIANKPIVIKKAVAERLAYEIVPDYAPQFDPEKHLFFFLKDKDLAGIHAYKNEAGKLIGYTIRVVGKETGKKVLPVTYCHNDKTGAELKEGWYLQGLPNKSYKPIYGLEKLPQDRKPILIVEGEKTTDAAQELLPNYTVISWLGGSTAAGSADWSKLTEREVVIWPDNDQPGLQAARTIEQKLAGIASSCFVVDPKVLELPSKWDLADRLPKGLSNIHITALLVSNKQSKSIKIIDQHIQALDHLGNSNEQLIKLLEREVLTSLKALGKDNNIYHDRLKEELAVIAKTNFAEDFVIAANIARYCQQMNIATGYGRGSAVSSLVAYGLGIHKIDPIEHDLLFERFLTAKTTKNPDFDFDIAASKRILVENYLCAKYHNAAKLSVIHQDGKTTFHPSGIGLIPASVQNKLAPEALTRITGKFWEDRQVLTIHHTEAEKLGVKKFDLLSSHVLESLQKLEALIASQGKAALGKEQANQLQGEKINWQQIGWSDKKAFELIKAGDTDGVYQLGSDLAKGACQKVKIDSFYDIVNLLALIRPGTTKYLDDFGDKNDSNNKFTDQKRIFNNQFTDPKEIFKSTQGVPLFQEQIMQAASTYLGIDKDEANDFRRELEKEHSNHPLIIKANFLQTATNKALTDEDANNLYKLLKQFSKFGFNKSHAVAYAHVTFKTAYLKAHYRELFNEIFKVADTQLSKDHEQEQKSYLPEQQSQLSEITGDTSQSEWREFTPEQLAHYQIVRYKQESYFAGFLKLHRQKLEDIKRLEPSYDITALISQLRLASDQGREQMLEAVWLGSFRRQFVPQIKDLQQQKTAAKNLNQLLEVLNKEKEFCKNIQDNYWDAAQYFKRVTKKSYIQSIYTTYNNKPELLKDIKRDAINAIKTEAMTEKLVLEELSTTTSLNYSANKLFKDTQEHLLSNIRQGLQTLKAGKVIIKDQLKFDNARAYLEHHLNDKVQNIYLKGTIAERQLAAIHQHHQQLEQQKQQELHKNL